MGARERCAIATICTICDNTVVEPTCSERITSAPLVLSVAPMSLSPTRFVTGNGSPVSMDSSRALLPSTTVPSTGDETVDQLIALALQAFADADAALAAGDLGGYQANVSEAQGYIDRANVLLSSSSATTPQTTVPSTIAPNPTIAGTPA